jgi:hypothetical protein
VVSPINLRLTEGLHLLHTTSDLRDIQVQGNRIRIVLNGHPASQGEMAFSGPRAKDLMRVSLDSVPLDLRAHGDLRQVQYGHRGLDQQVDLELS